MSAAADFESKVRAFAEEYAALFSSPDASQPDRVDALAERVGQYYRPGLTMFTNGIISRFETPADAASLIAREMHNNIATGLGTKLVLEAIEKVETYSATSALCWLRWRFEPQEGSEFEGRGWRMVIIYGFRAAGEGDGGGEDGWEFVLRDREVLAMREVTGGTFE